MLLLAITSGPDQAECGKEKKQAEIPRISEMYRRDVKSAEASFTVIVSP
jgi:hypothetical protein